MYYGAAKAVDREFFFIYRGGREGARRRKAPKASPKPPKFSSMPSRSFPKVSAQPPNASSKPSKASQKPPKASPKVPQSFPKPPQSLHRASQSLPKAFPKPPQYIPRASQKPKPPQSLPKDYPNYLQTTSKLPPSHLLAETFGVQMPFVLVLEDEWHLGRLLASRCHSYWSSKTNGIWRVQNR